MPRRSALCIAFIGFVSGLVMLASGNIPTAMGQPKPPVVTPAPQAPTLTTPANLGVKKGETVELTLTGTNLADPLNVLLSCPGKVTIPTDNKNGTEPAKLRVKVELPADCPIGLHTIRVATKQGVSNFRPFVVDEFPVVAETETNRTKETAQVVSFPVVITGRSDTEASDYFKVKVTAGQTLTFEVIARRLGSPLDPIVLLHDVKTNRALLELYADDTPGLQSDCRITHTFKEAGEFLVEVRDTVYRGGPDYFYRLRIGEFPGVTTAFPVAIQRGQTAKVGFAGPDAADIPSVNIKAPTDPVLAAVYATPKRPSGVGGWPVPVLLSDWPEIIEQEPNDEPAKANKLPVPGGVSAKFDKPHDVDHFAIVGKKGQKLVAAAQTYEINTPTEVLIRILDAKGTEIARSNPTLPAARVEFTPSADGEYVIACEQLNYLAGPNEIYHLTVQPVTPDFDIVLALDRCEAAAGNGTAVMATVNRLNGYAGPVELSIVGDVALSGSVTLPAGQTFAFVPLLVKAGTKPGAYSYQVQGKITANGQPVVRFGNLMDLVKTNLGGMSNPPPELLVGCAAAVVEKPAFALKLTADPTSMEKGKAGKVAIEATRGEGSDGDIAVAPLFIPPNITPAAAKPIAKGQT
ncbi:MAG TPA: hypothetical protein VG122_10100, partial [Gemmata sp.]|nr:hypothetical protein [Gemmata sp.]